MPSAAATAVNIALISRLNAGKIPSVNPLYDKDKMSVQVGRLPIDITNGSITRTMNTADDGMNFEIWWDQIGDPGYNPIVDFYTRPLGYEDVKGFCGGVQNFGGLTYIVSHNKTSDGRTKTVECYSKTRDIIDSTIDTSRGETYEAKNITLYNRCLSLCASRGIGVFLDIDPVVIAKANEPFPKVGADAQEKIFDHLLNLAKQRGLLISSTFDGDLFITRAKVAGLPVAILSEDLTSLPENYSITFDGTQRFSKHIGIGQNQVKAAQNFGIAIDTPIITSRTTTHVFNDTIPGGITSATNFEKNKSIGRHYSIPWTVNSWYSDPAQLLLWQPNTLVTILNSLTLNILTPFNFLIESVTYNFDESGSSATLSLVPPQVYTDNPVILEPWINVGGLPL